MRQIEADRVGMSLETFTQATSFENLMTATEALEFGLVDEIVEYKF